MIGVKILSYFKSRVKGVLCMEYLLLPRFDAEMMEAAPAHPADSGSCVLPCHLIAALVSSSPFVSQDVSEFIPY